MWFVDGEYVHVAGGAADFQPRNPLDDQCCRIIDVRNPVKPVEAGRWWFPGTREGDSAPPPRMRAPFDADYRAHNTNVYPERPDRAYVGYIDGGPGGLLYKQRSRIAAWTLERKRPSMFPTSLADEAGGLMACGPNQLAMCYRLAYFVDRILKRANPGDLPVEQATKFELVINLKPAKALGITILKSVLIQADRVIK